MPKRTANSYPLDNLKANIAVLKSINQGKNFDDFKEDMFTSYYKCRIAPTLKELGETASNKSINYCLSDLQKILDRLSDTSKVDLDFVNNEEHERDEKSN